MPCGVALLLLASAVHANTPLQDAMSHGEEAPEAQPEQTDYANAKLALKASYRIRYNGILAGEIRDELHLTEDGGYILSSVGETKGIFSIYGTVQRTSRGRLDDEQGLAVDRYQEKRGRFSSWRVAEFNGDGSVALSYGKERRVESVTKPTFDFLSALYAPFVTNHLPPTDGKVWLTDGWRLKQYDFAIDEEPELIDTAYGRVEGWRYSRVDKPDRQAWLAPELGFIMVQASGKSVEVELISYEKF